MNTPRVKKQTMETWIDKCIWMSLMPNRKERRQKIKNRVRGNTILTTHPDRASTNF